jgi:hypothetical protein
MNFRFATSIREDWLWMIPVESRAVCNAYLFSSILRRLRSSLLVAMTVLLVVGADAEGQKERWKKIENKYFSFSVPASFKKTRAHGIDSFAEVYFGKGIKLYFDYGDYSADFSQWPENTVLENVIIDGRPARIGTARADAKGATQTKVRIQLNFTTALSMFALCESERDVAIARRIFESIHFYSGSSQQ